MKTLITKNEELSLLVKNVKRMFYKRGRFSTYRKGSRQGKEERKCNDIGPRYNCKKPDHLIADCPDLKNKVSSFKKPFKKKAMKAT